MIFKDAIRADSSPKKYGEREFHFLDRSARPEMQKVRLFLEQSASSYPQDHLEELTARMRCGNDTHFRSATFELIIHTALLRAGAKLQVHPETKNGARPDFLVTCPDSSQFYLEAVLASEQNWINDPAEARKSGVINALAEARHANFWVDIESEGEPNTQPSGNQMVASTLAWLNSLNVDEIYAQIENNGFNGLPEHNWEHENWKLTLRPLPVSPRNRGKTTTLIGAYSDGAGWINAWQPIANAVKHKGNKYGDLGSPLLIAVNVDSFHLDQIDEVQGLFGEEQLIFSTANPEAEPRMERARNGAWWGRHGPQYRRVSGAWLFNDLMPSTIGIRRQSIYFNPWATHALPSWLEMFPHTKGVDGILHATGGATFSTVLGLASGWPE